MRAEGYVYDPLENTVKPVIIDGLEDMYRVLDCQRVEAFDLYIRHSDGCIETVWVDEDGQPDHGVSNFMGDIYIGRLLFLATNHRGETVSTQMPLWYLERLCRPHNGVVPEPRIEVLPFPE